MKADSVCSRYVYKVDEPRMVAAPVISYPATAVVTCVASADVDLVYPSDSKVLRQFLREFGI